MPAFLSVTWIGITIVAGITSAMYDRQYHHSQILSGTVSVLSNPYTPDTTMCILWWGLVAPLNYHLIRAVVDPLRSLDISYSFRS